MQLCSRIRGALVYTPEHQHLPPSSTSSGRMLIMKEWEQHSQVVLSRRAYYQEAEVPVHLPHESEQRSCPHLGHSCQHSGAPSAKLWAAHLAVRKLDLEIFSIWF